MAAEMRSEEMPLSGTCCFSSCISFSKLNLRDYLGASLACGKLKSWLLKVGSKTRQSFFFILIFV